MLGIANPINWAGFAAVLTAFAGLMAAYAAVVRARRETKHQADDECLEKLKLAREDFVKSSDELYELRKQQAMSRDVRPEENNDMERWSHLP